MPEPSHQQREDAYVGRDAIEKASHPPGLVARALNRVLPVFERAVLHSKQVIKRLATRQRSKAAGVVVHSAGEDDVIGERSVEECYHLRPRASHVATSAAGQPLTQIPPGDAVRHVLEVPVPVRYASGAERSIADVAERVVTRRAVTGINEELDAR